jgi:hypothetical protein
MMTSETKSDPILGVACFRDTLMRVCERCGEKYPSDAKYSTPDYCGTCIFINGNPPVDRLNQPQTYAVKVQPPANEEDEDSQLV